MTNDLTPLGRLLEYARGSMSKRQAALRAGISEGRWRQIVTGVQKVGSGVEVEAHPRRETVIAMAEAVGANVNSALEAAGFQPLDGDRIDIDESDPAVEKVRSLGLPRERQDEIIRELYELGLLPSERPKSPARKRRAG